MNNKKKSFTVLELVVVIAILGIISAVSIQIDNNNLIIARDQLMKHIQYTQSLALFDDKFKFKPDSNSSEDIANTKYWFKGMWQVQIQMSQNKIFYSIYHDRASSSGNWYFQPATAKTHNDEVAIDPETRNFLIGAWKDVSATTSPWNNLTKDDVNTKLNLTYKFNTQSIKIRYESGQEYERNITGGNTIHIFFDNFGRVYLFPTKGGMKSSAYDSDKTLHPFKHQLRETVQFKLSDKSKDSLCFNLEPNGYIYIEDCSF